MSLLGRDGERKRGNKSSLIILKRKRENPN